MKTLEISKQIRTGLFMVLFSLMANSGFSLAILGGQGVGELQGGVAAPNTLCQPCADPQSPNYASAQCGVIRQQMIDTQSAQRAHIANAQGGDPYQTGILPTQALPNPSLNNVFSGQQLNFNR